MSRVLPDGTVIPSWLGCGSTETHPAYAPRPGLHQYALRVGTILKVYYPDDLDNIRKNRIEYDVQVTEQSDNKGSNVSVYQHCVCADLFGGIGDSVEYTLRPSSDPTNPDPTHQTGSQVLILCLHGDKNGGVIIGGLRNLRRPDKSLRERGHFLEFEFNGVNFEINKDGELTLTYQSRTDIGGVPQDTKSGGSFIKIDKQGSIEINDADAGIIKIEKPSKVCFANAPTIKLGGLKANEKLVLGNTFMKFYNQMVKVFNNHTHNEKSWNPDPTNPAHLNVTRKPTNKLKRQSFANMSKDQLSDFVYTKKKYEK